MRFPVEGHRFFGFFPPYRGLQVLDHPYQIPRGPFPNRGSALVWNLRLGELVSGIRAVQARPPGVALFILLPPSSELGSDEALLQLMTSCRPHSSGGFRLSSIWKSQTIWCGEGSRWTWTHADSFEKPWNFQAS